jgi:hypothetical protein
MITIVGKGATAGVVSTWTYTESTSAGSSGVDSVSATCVAIKSVVAGSGTSSSDWKTSFGQSSIDDALTAWSSWWCSNGLYKTVTSSTAGVLNGTQVFLSGSNQRRELARVGCPQKAAFCGVTSSAAITSIFKGTLTSTAVIIEVATTSTLTYNEKCTWAAGSYEWAPTFVFSAGATSGAPGITTANWQIHTMEYTTAASFSAATGSLGENGSSTGYVAAGVGASRGTYLPHFAAPADQFATLRTWYGDGAATAAGSLTGQPAAWYAPGRNPLTTANSSYAAEVAGQQWGNVAHMPSSTYYSSTAAIPAGSTATYGALGSAGTAKFDLRVVRYMPAQVALSVWTAGNALLTQYNSEKSSYDTAKTTWDAYVAILTKNAKMDAFAAAFSPPKAPTVPPLPNKPWLPSSTTVATAMSRLPPLQVQLGNIKASGGGVNVTGATQPTAANFWTSEQAALVAGGWGSFTAATIKYRNGWGKSFGTIGYSDAGTTGWNGLAQVYNQQWQCSHSGTGTTFLVTPSATTACPATYTAIAGTLGTAANNTVNFYVAISVWAVKTTSAGVGTIFGTTGTNSSNFSLEFTIGTWSSALQLAAPGAMAAATAASSLTGVAGAHALAASAAAALATAAALY